MGERREERRLQRLALSSHLRGLPLLEKLRPLHRNRDNARERIERAKFDRSAGGRQEPHHARAKTEWDETHHVPAAVDRSVSRKRPGSCVCVRIGFEPGEGSGEPRRTEAEHQRTGL